MSLTYLMSVKNESLGEFLAHAPSRGFTPHQLNATSWQLLDAYDGDDALVVMVYGEKITDGYTVGPDHVNGAWVEARRLELGLTRPQLVRYLDSKGFSGWSPRSLAQLAKDGAGRALDMLATREFVRAFGEAAADRTRRVATV